MIPQRNINQLIVRLQDLRTEADQQATALENEDVLNADELQELAGLRSRRDAFKEALDALKEEVL